MAYSKGRAGQAWWRMRRRVLAEEPCCWLCGKVIEHDVYPPRHPQSPSVDHVIPMSKGGPELDRANLRAAHFGCNAQRGDRMPKPCPFPTSRQW